MICEFCAKELTLVQISFDGAVYVCTRDCDYNKRDVCLYVKRNFRDMAKPANMLKDEIEDVLNSLDSQDEYGASTKDVAWISQLLNDVTVVDDKNFGTKLNNVTFDDNDFGKELNNATLDDNNGFDFDDFLKEIGDCFGGGKSNDESLNVEAVICVGEDSQSKWNNFKFTSVTLPPQQHIKIVSGVEDCTKE